MGSWEHTSVALSRLYFMNRSRACFVCDCSDKFWFPGDPSGVEDLKMIQIKVAPRQPKDSLRQLQNNSNRRSNFCTRCHLSADYDSTMFANWIENVSFLSSKVASRLNENCITKVKASRRKIVRRNGGDPWAAIVGGSDADSDGWFTRWRCRSSTLGGAIWYEDGSKRGRLEVARLECFQLAIKTHQDSNRVLVEIMYSWLFI